MNNTSATYDALVLMPLAVGLLCLSVVYIVPAFEKLVKRLRSRS